MKTYMLLAGIATASACVQLAHATTYTVTNIDDNGGTNPAVGAGTGTLRQAIVDSNADTGTTRNDIVFNIPGAGVHTITLLSPNSSAPSLPIITHDVLIDGTSQPGWLANTNVPDQGGLNGNLVIEIDGGGTAYRGFQVNGNLNVTINGLAIYGISGDAIDGDRGSLGVYGCHLGAKADGSVPPLYQYVYGNFGNYGVGIRTNTSSAQIGGQAAAQRNLISGNGGGGIYVGYAAVIEGNLIGTDITGTAANKNAGWPGIVVPGNVPGVRIGCTGSSCTAAGHPSRNVISGNRAYGIGIWDGFSQGAPETGGLQIKGNYIGTDWTGDKPLPNGSLSDTGAGCPTYCGGLQIQNGNVAPASVIGGFNPGEANLIAFNGGPGIVSAHDSVDESFDNQGNAIHNNASTDIAFGLNGWMPNDAGDADTGANNMQNYPVIQSAHVSGNQLTVNYSVDSSTMNSTYPLRIDFYVDIDEGSGAWLVSDSYPASSAQMARSVTLTLPASALPLVGFVAAATDANGYSSEFSPSLVFDRIFANGFD